jgi:hypothetical protein
MAALVISHYAMDSNQVACFYHRGETLVPTLEEQGCSDDKGSALITFLTNADCTADCAVADTSNSGHSATPQGHAHVDFTGAHFDGDRDFYTIGDFDYETDGSFSIAFWYTKEQCTGGIYEYLYSHNNQAAPSIELTTNSNVNMYLSCNEAGTTILREYLIDANGVGSGLFFDYPVHSAGDFDLITARWIHHALVLTPGTVQVYLDGELLSGVSNGGILGNTAFTTSWGGFDMRTDIYVGSRADQNTEREFVGAIALLQIYSSNINGVQASCNFSSGRNDACPRCDIMCAGGVGRTLHR